MRRIEYNIKLPTAQLRAISKQVLGGPLYVRLSDRKVVAHISTSRVKAYGLLLGVSFQDSFLEKFVDNPRQLNGLYILIDPLECLLTERN